MSKKKFEMDSMFRVYEEGQGNYIEVKRCPYCPDHINISVPAHCEEYFGKMNVSIPAEFASLLSDAIFKAIKCNNLLTIFSGKGGTEGADGCTDPENCRRCQTMPEHRGNMQHAGIGSYPTPRAHTGTGRE